MKIAFVTFFILISFLLVFSVTAINAGSSTNDKEAQKIIVLPKSENIDEDYFAFGDKTTISGTVNGDAYTAAGVVIVDGTINGDLFVGGGTVFISGSVANDLRVGGGQVTVSGIVNGNVSAGGGSVTFTDDSSIGGSLLAGAGSLSLFGPIGRGATIGAGDLTIANSVGGNMKAGVGQLTLNPNANIAGDLTYWSDTEADVQEGAVVVGETTKKLSQSSIDTKEVERSVNDLKSGFRIVSLISVFILGLLIIRFFPNFAEDVVSTVSRKTLLSLGIGLITIVLVPIVSLLLLITVVGIPIMLLLLFSFITSLLILKVFISLAIGKYVSNVANIKLSNWLTLLLGLAVYTIITLVPILGGIFSALAILVGLGAIVMSKRSLYKQFRSKKLI